MPLIRGGNPEKSPAQRRKTRRISTYKRKTKLDSGRGRPPKRERIEASSEGEALLPPRPVVGNSATPELTLTQPSGEDLPLDPTTGEPFSLADQRLADGGEGGVERNQQQWDDNSNASFAFPPHSYPYPNMEDFGTGPPYPGPSDSYAPSLAGNSNYPVRFPNQAGVLGFNTAMMPHLGTSTAPNNLQSVIHGHSHRHNLVDTPSGFAVHDPLQWRDELTSRRIEHTEEIPVAILSSSNVDMQFRCRLDPNLSNAIVNPSVVSGTGWWPAPAHELLERGERTFFGFHRPQNWIFLSVTMPGQRPTIVTAYLLNEDAEGFDMAIPPWVYENAAAGGIIAPAAANNGPRDYQGSVQWPSSAATSAGISQNVFTGHTSQPWSLPTSLSQDTFTSYSAHDSTAPVPGVVDPTSDPRIFQRTTLDSPFFPNFTSPFNWPPT